MVISKLYMKFLLFQIFMSLFLLANAEEDVIYTVAISENARSCDEFQNTVLILDGLTMGDTYNGESCLMGSAILKEDIPEGTEISISVWKVDGLVDEFLYTADGDFCSSVDKVESPWYPLFDSFGQTKCPIAANTYDVSNMSLDMDYAQDYMNSKNCGEYRMEMSLMNETDKISCHIVQVVIEEERQN